MCVWVCVCVCVDMLHLVGRLIALIASDEKRELVSHTVEPIVKYQFTDHNSKRLHLSDLSELQATTQRIS